MLNIIQKIQTYIILKLYETNIRIVYTLIILVILRNVKLELFLFWCIFLDISVPQLGLLLEIYLWPLKQMAWNQGFFFFSVACFMSKSNTSFNI